ncbi:hypothetical protein B0H12DRAFT_1259049 [Mycena haematopus]|nr:hypothetical protein B0H12DRAFT_1259049 [Mycena haematopus]
MRFPNADSIPTSTYKLRSPTNGFSQASHTPSRHAAAEGRPSPFSFTPGSYTVLLRLTPVRYLRRDPKIEGVLRPQGAVRVRGKEERAWADDDGMHERKGVTKPINPYRESAQQPAVDLPSSFYSPLLLYRVPAHRLRFLRSLPAAGADAPERDGELRAVPGTDGRDTGWSTACPRGEWCITGQANAERVENRPFRNMSWREAETALVLRVDLSRWYNAQWCGGDDVTEAPSSALDCCGGLLAPNGTIPIRIPPVSASFAPYVRALRPPHPAVTGPPPAQETGQPDRPQMLVPLGPRGRFVGGVLRRNEGEVRGGRLRKKGWRVRGFFSDDRPQTVKNAASSSRWRCAARNEGECTLWTPAACAGEAWGEEFAARMKPIETGGLASAGSWGMQAKDRRSELDSVAESPVRVGVVGAPIEAGGLRQVLRVPLMVHGVSRGGSGRRAGGRDHAGDGRSGLGGTTDNLGGEKREPRTLHMQVTWVGLWGAFTWYVGASDLKKLPLAIPSVQGVLYPAHSGGSVVEDPGMNSDFVEQ